LRSEKQYSHNHLGQLSYYKFHQAILPTGMLERLPFAILIRSLHCRACFRKLTALVWSDSARKGALE
jgi:hypothetical protein